MLKAFLLLFISFVILNAQNINDTKIEIFATTLTTKDSIVTASGNIAVVYKDYYLTASKAIYNQKSGILELFENVRANQNSGYKTLGNYAKLNIKNKKRIFKPFYMLEKDTQTWISADKGTINDKNLEVSSGIVSSCDPEKPIWKMEFQSSDYNLDKKWLNLYNTVIYIYDIPVFYTPWFGYSLDKTRGTGLLIPAIGYSQDEGIYYEQPFYIAEYNEWDLELKPQIRTTRGLGIYSTLRFVDSAVSSGNLSLGYFKEKESYFKSVNLKNKEHYGIKFDYENNDILNSWLDIKSAGQSGLYIDIGFMNDVDYINLESNDIINSSTATQVVSKMNLFYNTGDDYFASYFKYYQYLNVESNAQTLQELPKLHYHHYLDTMFNENIFYNIDIQSKNIHREINTKVIQTDINIPISFHKTLFDEHLDISFKSNFYVQHSFFNGDEIRTDVVGEYENGYIAKNSNIISVSSQLTKSFTGFSHVLAFGGNYVFDGFENKDGFYKDNKEFCQKAKNINEPLCEFYNIYDTEEELQFDFSQYIYDLSGRQLIYHRLVQNMLLSTSKALGELENEFEYRITHAINFYNNMFYNHDNNKFSKIYNRISYRDKGFDIALSYLYRDSSLNTSYLTTSVNYEYSSQWKYSVVYDYDIELDVRKRAEIGFIYSKRCWDFGMRYAENNRPELGRDSAIVNRYDKYVYFTIALKPFMSSAESSFFAYKLPDTEEAQNE